MSMSTNIDDLPGEDSYVEENEMEPIERMGGMKRMGGMERMGVLPRSERMMEELTNIEDDMPKLIIKRKYSELGIVELLGSELKLQNIILLIIIFMATTINSNEYTRKMLSFIPLVNSGWSHFSVTIIKCILLLIVYLIIKNFVK